MSVSNSSSLLDLATARLLPTSTEIVVKDRTDGSVVERVTILRYAGHYRTGATHGFAIKDSEGKFRVRSARHLGLTEDSDFVAHLADVLDLREPSASDVA